MPELLPDAAAPRRAGPAGAGPAPGMSVLGRPEVCRAAGRRETTPRAITNAAAHLGEVAVPAPGTSGGASPTLRYNRLLFRYGRVGVRVKRSDGAKAWSTVLSELAQVPVSVAWERPSWRVSWQDGPTREALMGRAAALGTYRVGAPLPFEDLRFARSSSALALAVAWLARGSPGSPATARAAVADVEAFCADTGYPQARFDAGTLAAAELLRRVGHGDIAEMGALLARAVPPVAASVMLPARSRADRSGGHLPRAAQRPAGRVARALRSTR